MQQIFKKNSNISGQKNSGGIRVNNLLPKRSLKKSPYLQAGDHMQKKIQFFFFFFFGGGGGGGVLQLSFSF